jgi:hypothetical protein
VLASSADFDFNDFQPVRARNALGDLPDSIQIKSHDFSNLRRKAAPVPRANRPKLKSGLAPTGVLRQS